MVLPAMTAMPASPALATPSTVRGPTVGRSKRNPGRSSAPSPARRGRIWRGCGPPRAAAPPAPATRRCPRCPRPRPRARRSRQRPDRYRMDQRASTSRPLAISAAAAGSGVARAMLPAGISISGRDIPDADHPEPILFENAADARQQMIVAAAKRRPDVADDADGSPVQPDLRQRRPHQRADEDQVAAAFAAEQLVARPSCPTEIQ